MKQKDDPSRRVADSYPLQFELRTLFSDMDAFRHINNGAIGRFFEEGRADLNIRVFGVGSLINPSGGLLLLFANITLDYLHQVHYPGAVTIATGVSRIGNSSYIVAQAAFQNQRCVALAEVVMVKAIEDRPAPLTDAERDSLKAVMWALPT